MKNTFLKAHFCNSCFRRRTTFKNVADFVLENNKKIHLIIRNIPTVCISDSFGNITHFHDSPTQSFITSCAVKISFSSSEAASSPQDNLDLTESDQWLCWWDHSHILALVQCICASFVYVALQNGELAWQDWYYRDRKLGLFHSLPPQETIGQVLKPNSNQTHPWQCHAPRLHP